MVVMALGFMVVAMVMKLCVYVVIVKNTEENADENRFRADSGIN